MYMYHIHYLLYVVSTIHVCVHFSCVFRFSCVVCVCVCVCVCMCVCVFVYFSTKTRRAVSQVVEPSPLPCTRESTWDATGRLLSQQETLQDHRTRYMYLLMCKTAILSWFWQNSVMCILKLGHVELTKISFLISLSGIHVYVRITALLIVDFSSVPQRLIIKAWEEFLLGMQRTLPWIWNKISVNSMRPDVNIHLFSFEHLCHDTSTSGKCTCSFVF